MKKITMSIFVLVGIFTVAIPNMAKSGPTIISICGENKFIDPVNNFVNTVSYNKTLSSRSSAVFDICQAEIPLPVEQASLDAYTGTFELSTDGGITRTNYSLNLSHVQSTNSLTGEKKWRITIAGLDPNATFEPSVNSRWAVLRGGFENRAFGDQFKLSNDFPETITNGSGSGSSQSSGDGRKRFAPGQFAQFVAERQAQTIAQTTSPAVVVTAGTPVVEKVPAKVVVNTPKIREYDPEIGYIDQMTKRGNQVYNNNIKKVVEDTIAPIIGDKEVVNEMITDEEPANNSATASAANVVGKGFFWSCFWWWIIIAIIAFLIGRATKNDDEDKKSKK